MPVSIENESRRRNHSSSAEIISEKSFRRLRDIVYQESGISLGDQKRIMLSTRISRRMRAVSCSTFEEYIDLISDPSVKYTELVRMIDAVTTNKTDFFREKHHFQYMTETLLPELVRKHRFTEDNPLRIWSAGCSSGEEPYTMAFVLSEFFGQSRSLFRVTASDLSTNVLRKAVRAVYSDQTVADVPKALRQKYMMRGEGEWAGYWRVRPEIRKTVTFGRLNFIDANYGIPDRFHIIFHRNVMIYFELQTRASIVGKLSQHLVDRGHLFIGHSETLHQLSQEFDIIAQTIYQKRGSEKGGRQ